MMEYHPRIGPGYPNSRLLVVSESAYSWTEDGGPELIHPGPDHPSKTIEYAIAEFDNRLGDGFLRRATQALAGKRSPSLKERHAAWDVCAYTIYVQDTVGDGPRQRPTIKMFQAAQNVFLQLINRLEPRLIVIFGLDAWAQFPESQVHLVRDLQAYRLSSGQLSWCLALEHPASLKWIGWKNANEAIKLFQTIAFPTNL